jgi:two-component system sensor histidine kinase GlrK
LIENFLEYQKAISIQSKLSVSEFCLLKLATSLEKEYKLLLASKQLRLQIAMSEQTVETDREKLKIILSNLLSNAIKFAPQASTISLSAKVESGKLFFSVEDQGDGIDESMREKIFEDFFQENRSEKFTLKGTGLGLAIVRFYVEKLDGSIELLAPSEDYPGARFSLMIPIR